MLGYTNKDIANMMRGIRDGLFYLPPSAEESVKNLRMAMDFFNGIEAEGYLD